MRLTALTLHGFKSFGNRTTLEFSPGVTAIVGPNGSGKSNVIDALKWASGGGRASEFRAGDKTELIFHGAAGKRSLGYAEVELELRSQAKKVNIFRSLHRDGTGRLRMNGKNARFLDIDEELAGSGLGKSGLAIIGQGEVSGVLMADPGKLLQYVAEAAGVARLAGRREQTEDRLETARGHLERIEDLMQELERQLERLEEEAAGAARHAELTRETLQLRYTLARLREEAVRSELGALRVDRDKLGQEIDEVKAQLQQARQTVAARREEHEASEARYREALAASEARRGDVRVARAKLESHQVRLADLRNQLGAIDAELASLQDLKEPESVAGADVEELERAARAALEAVVQAREKRDQTEEELRAARLELDELRRKAAQQAQVEASHGARREALQLELQHLLGREQELEEGARELGDPAELEEALAAARAEHEAAEQRLAGIRTQLEEAQQEHASAWAEAQARARAAERSRQAFEARRGYAEGPRNALSSGIPGVYGSVADLVRVPEQVRDAIGAALGRRMEYVVVDTPETGQRVLKHVRRSGGFVTVLPLELVEGRRTQLSARFAQAGGVLGLASELIEVEGRFRKVVDQLLGNTAVVRTMEDAVELSRRERSRPRMVTLEGDIVESYGAMSGGRRQLNAGVLGAAAELEDAEAAAAEADRLAQESQERLLGLQERHKEAAAVIEGLRGQQEELAGELSARREAWAARNELRSDLAKRQERVRAQLLQLEAQVPQLENVDHGRAAQRVEELEARLAEQNELLDGLQAEANERRQERVVAAERRQAYEAARQQYVRDMQRRKALEERREQERQELANRTKLEQRAQEELDRAQQNLPGDLVDRERELEAAVQAFREAEDTVTRLSEHLSRSSEALERINVTLARRESAWELAVEELKQFPEGLPVLDGGERNLRARLNEASRELEELGAVNHRATLELEAEKARHAQLLEEWQAGNDAIAELAGALQQLDAETTSRLELGVARLREGFRRHVIELFGDTAQADIEVEREEGRPTGVRIRLQPPGKQTRQLNLLSVGERTMGAMAFLFALMSEEGAEGLPIAVLDEVDAPLDEANIRRYCDFLAKMARRGTQFILITHQKATFEVADAIWGVTTEGGVSRVFSIAKPDAVAVG